MANLEDAAHFLRGADKILILSHRSPDGDTLGCASALSRALIALGKSVMFRCADPVPPNIFLRASNTASSSRSIS